MTSPLDFWAEAVEPDRLVWSSDDDVPTRQQPWDGRLPPGRWYLPLPGSTTARYLGCACRPQPPYAHRRWVNLYCPLHGIEASEARRASPERNRSTP